jgi:D-sedoheptulose 7-phosphate isomerase
MRAIDVVIKELETGAELRRRVARELADTIVSAAQMITSAYSSGGKVLLIGNGGSAADAQHIAAELVGRFEAENKGRPAIALTTDTSVLTAISNDYGYDSVFSRQIEALADKGDVLIAISTSGHSINILNAVDAAHKAGVKVIGLTGKDGGALKAKADLAITIPSDSVPRIQEIHITIGHIICNLVKKGLIK